MLKYLSTIRYLRPVQIFNRIYRIRNVASASADISAPPRLVIGRQEPFAWLPRPKSVLSNEEFLFLNRILKLRFPEGWEDQRASRLWLYNLHYFDYLHSPELSASRKKELIERWISDNPPVSGSGWEPYPLSLRIVNWIKWSLQGGQLSDTAKHSLAVQTRWLLRSLEYHLMGNHLFTNAKALIFAGASYEGPEADSWLRKGLSILHREVKEQFLSDGGHFELSTTYHALLSEDLLDLLQLGGGSRFTPPDHWREAASKALGWLQIMTRPDGVPPLFNDAAYGTAPDLAALTGYARALGVDPKAFEPGGMTDLKASGYFRFDGEGYSLFGDAGQIGPDYIPGHGHADMLNFELFANGRPIIVDTGISTYEAGPRRSFERSTRAHNTVEIGEESQSEMWAAFRVGRRARIVRREAGEDWLEAGHNGYRGAIHRRRFAFEDKSLRISDVIERSAGGGPTARAYFHFHPDIAPTLTGNTLSIDGLLMTVSGFGALRLEDYDYAPSFGILEPAKVLCAEFDHQLETTISI